MSYDPPPPPPPSGSASQFDIGSALSYGWRKYWRNCGPLIIMTLIIIVVNFVLQLIGGNASGALSAVILAIVGLLVGVVLAMGLIRGSLAVVEGRPADWRMLFQTDAFGPYLVATILVGLGVFVGTLACIIPGVILAIMWQLYGYVIIEAPTTVPTDAMRRSADLTRGHRWPLFGLGLVLFFLNLLGILLFGIGVIFTYGITAVTLAWTYKALSGQPVSPA